jgi:hypothetical protein
MSLLQSPSRLLRTRSHGYTSQVSLHDKFTLGSVRIINSSASSFDRDAEDRVLGRDMLKQIGQVVTQIKPHHKLSLFEIGILADVIHRDKLNYSLLQYQCYWLVETMCQIIVLIYGNDLKSKSATKNALDPLPPSQYLPNLSCRWNSLLISTPKDDALKRIGDEYVKRRDEEFLKVDFY